MSIPLRYIAECGDSGSTLLDRLLGSHSQIECLGEVKTFGHCVGPNAQSERLVTCRSSLENCRFWGPISKLLERKFGGEFTQIETFDQSLFQKLNVSLLEQMRLATGKRIIGSIRVLRGFAAQAAPRQWVIRKGATRPGEKILGSKWAVTNRLYKCFFSLSSS